MTRERLNELIAGIRTMRMVLTDEQAANAPGFFKEWKPNESYSSGERVQKNGVLYTVLQNHTSQDGWAPADAPSLFAKVLPGQGGAEIGEWMQPDSTNPYQKGDRVLYKGSIWECTIDNNVWEPDVYGWTKV